MARSTRRSAPAPASRRSASTMAAPAPAAAMPPPRAPAPAPVAPAAAAPTAVAAPSAGPGLFGQMAATAGGVAVGSAVGHVIGAGLTGMFSGGGSSSEAAAQPAPAAQQQPYYYQQPQQQPYAYSGQTAGYENNRACDFELNKFSECIKASGGDVSACQYVVDMLKACQARVASM